MNHVEQNLTNEIISLFREDFHTRAIAERLASNHATVRAETPRSYKRQYCRFSGWREKTKYSPSRTIEGRNAAIIAEMYKQSIAVSRYPVLRGIIRAVQDMPEIPLALLYGRYAKGLAKKDSDIDLFIETLNTSLKKRLGTAEFVT